MKSNIKDDYFVAGSFDFNTNSMTLTARSESSHQKRKGSISIDPLTGQAKCVWGHWKPGLTHPMGNDWQVFCRNLSKKDAEYLKEHLMRLYKSMGWTYFPLQKVS